MNNTDLNELLAKIQPTKNEKNEMENAYNSITSIVQNNTDGNLKVAEIHLGGSFRKGTIIKGRKEIDIVIVISPKNKKKKFIYTEMASISMNFLENALYFNYYDKLNNVEKNKKITRNYERNTLSLLNSNNVSVDFLVKFKKEQLKSTTDSEVENFYLERDCAQLTFINEADLQYSKFKNSVMLLKHFRNEQKLNQLKSYMIEIILYYSLNTYFTTNDYTGYLTAFFRGLKDFIYKKTIEVDDDMYLKVGTNFTECPKDNYRVLDVANRSNNVAKYITNNDIIKIKEFYDMYNDQFWESSSNLNEETLSQRTYILNFNQEYSSIERIIPHMEASASYNLTLSYNVIKNDNALEDIFYKQVRNIIKLHKRHKFGKKIIIKCNDKLLKIFNKSQQSKSENYVNYKKRIEDIEFKVQFIKNNS